MKSLIFLSIILFVGQTWAMDQKPLPNLPPPQGTTPQPKESARPTGFDSSKETRKAYQHSCKPFYNRER